MAVGVSATVASVIGTVAALATTFLGNTLLGGGSSAPSNPVADLSGRTENVRAPISPQRLIVGETLVGGTEAYVSATDDNKYLHIILCLAGHDVEAIGDVYFNDELVPLKPHGAGFVPASGTWTGSDATPDEFVYLEKYLGAADQTASPVLRAHDPAWTEAHRGRGIAYLYVRLTWSVDKWPNGRPTVKAVVKGAKFFDPRTGATAWTSNWAIIQAGYTCDPKFGLAAVYADEIDEATLIAAANVCDEMVAVENESYDGRSDGLFLQVLTTTARAPRIGDKMTIGAGAYYVASCTFIERNDSGHTFRLTFGASLADGRAGVTTAIPVGSQTATRTHEPRYTCNGTIDADKARRDVLDELRSAAAGAMVYSGGTWKMFPAAWRTPDVTLTLDDLRGPIRISTKISRRDNFNGVKGVFVDPSQGWQATDYPPVEGSAYLALDGNERTWGDRPRPFTDSPSMAQRLGKIDLERTRRPITLTLPCKLTAFRVSAMGTVQVTIDRYGWDAKTFEVQNWKLVVDTSGDAPTLGVDLVLRELDANAFVWASDEEALLPAAPATTLPGVFNVPAPGVPDVVETLYETRGSAGVKSRATMTWAAAPDSFVDTYQPEFRLASAETWTVLAPVRGTTSVELGDLAPGIYEFRVKAVNAFGVSSSYATRRKEILGLLGPPADVTGLSIAIISSLALLQFDRHPDLDVRQGGYLRVRHSPASTGATWDGAVDVGKVDGTATQAIVPAISGTYLVKAVDSSGVHSVNAATVTTNAASLLAFSNLDTITEDPTFGGTKTNCAVSSSKLSLTGNTLFDDIADLDAVASLDTEGGISATGLYEFASGTDLASVQPARITAAVTASVVNTLDQFDSRGASVDDWETWDGDIAAAAGCYVEIRQTDDDPAGTPTWGDWHRLTVGDYRARAFEYRLQLFTDDPAYNIEVSALTVTADERV